MLATLKMIREKYGSAEDYLLKHCKVSPETIAKVRENLVVKS